MKHKNREALAQLAYEHILALVGDPAVENPCLDISGIIEIAHDADIKGLRTDLDYPDLFTRNDDLAWEAAYAHNFKAARKAIRQDHRLILGDDDLVTLDTRLMSVITDSARARLETWAELLTYQMGRLAKARGLNVHLTMSDANAALEKAYTTLVDL